jgi:hypothetical protein
VRRNSGGEVRHPADPRKHDEFSQFYKLFNETQLAGDINRD